MTPNAIPALLAVVYIALRVGLKPTHRFAWDLGAALPPLVGIFVADRLWLQVSFGLLALVFVGVALVVDRRRNATTASLVQPHRARATPKSRFTR